MESEPKMLDNEEDGEYRKPQIFIDQLFQLSKVSSVIDDAAIKDEIDTMFSTVR